MAMQDDAFDEASELFRSMECGGCFFHAGCDLLDPGCSQTRGRGVRIRELPRRLKPGKDLFVGVGREQHLDPAQQPGDVGSSATLRTQPAAGTKRTVEHAKEAVVIANPVKGS